MLQKAKKLENAWGSRCKTTQCEEGRDVGWVQAAGGRRLGEVEGAMWRGAYRSVGSKRNAGYATMRGINCQLRALQPRHESTSPPCQLPPFTLPSSPANSSASYPGLACARGNGALTCGQGMTDSRRVRHGCSSVTLPVVPSQLGGSDRDLSTGCTHIHGHTGHRRRNRKASPTVSATAAAPPATSPRPIAPSVCSPMQTGRST